MIKLMNIHRQIFFLKPETIISVKIFLRTNYPGNRDIIEININNTEKEYVLYENIVLFLKLIEDFNTESNHRYYKEMFLEPQPRIM